MKPKMREWVQKLPLKAQTKLDNAGKHKGQLTSNTIESAWHALADVRECGDAYRALKGVVDYFGDKFVLNSAEAFATQTHATDAQIKALAKLEAKASKLVLSVVFQPVPRGGALDKARVKMVSRADAACDCCLSTRSCSCGLPASDDDLCLHLVAAALKTPKPLQFYAFEDRCAAKHRRQYEVMAPWPVVDWEAVVPTEVRYMPYQLPWATKRARGRPAYKRKRSIMDHAEAAARKRLRSERSARKRAAGEGPSDDDTAGGRPGGTPGGEGGGDASEAEEEEEDVDGAQNEEEDAANEDEDEEEEGATQRLRSTAARRANATSRDFEQLPGNRA